MTRKWVSCFLVDLVDFHPLCLKEAQKLRDKILEHAAAVKSSAFWVDLLDLMLLAECRGRILQLVVYNHRTPLQVVDAAEYFQTISGTFQTQVPPKSPIWTVVLHNAAYVATDDRKLLNHFSPAWNLNTGQLKEVHRSNLFLLEQELAQAKAAALTLKTADRSAKRLEEAERKLQFVKELASDVSLSVVDVPGDGSCGLWSLALLETGLSSTQCLQNDEIQQWRLELSAAWCKVSDNIYNIDHDDHGISHFKIFKDAAKTWPWEDTAENGLDDLDGLPLKASQESQDNECKIGTKHFSTLLSSLQPAACNPNPKGANLVQKPFVHGAGPEVLNALTPVKRTAASVAQSSSDLVTPEKRRKAAKPSKASRTQKSSGIANFAQTLQQTGITFQTWQRERLQAHSKRNKCLTDINDFAGFTFFYTVITVYIVYIVYIMIIMQNMQTSNIDNIEDFCDIYIFNISNISYISYDSYVSINSTMSYISIISLIFLIFKIFDFEGMTVQIVQWYIMVQAVRPLV